MHLGLLFLMLSTSFVSGTFSQNLNKNALKSQCDFQHVLKTKFTISDYENNIRKFKYIYSFDKELDEDQGVTLYIDNKTCLFLTNKYKKIGFKDNEDEYYKLKNIIVSTNVFTGSLEDCLQLEDIDTLYQEACIIHKEITTQKATTTTSQQGTTTTAQQGTTTTSQQGTTTTAQQGTTTTSQQGTTTTSQQGTTTTETATTTTAQQGTTINVNNSLIKSNTSQSSEDQKKSIGISTGTIVGIIVGSVFGLCLILFTIVITIKKSKKNKKIPVFENVIYDTNTDNKTRETNVDDIAYEQPVSYNPEYITYTKENTNSGEYQTGEPLYNEEDE